MAVCTCNEDLIKQVQGFLSIQFIEYTDRYRHGRYHAEYLLLFNLIIMTLVLTKRHKVEKKKAKSVRILELNFVNSMLKMLWFYVYKFS